MGNFFNLNFAQQCFHFFFCPRAKNYDVKREDILFAAERELMIHCYTRSQKVFQNRISVFRHIASFRCWAEERRKTRQRHKAHKNFLLFSIRRKFQVYCIMSRYCAARRDFTVVKWNSPAFKLWQQRKKWKVLNKTRGNNKYESLNNCYQRGNSNSLIPKQNSTPSSQSVAFEA